MVEDGDLTELDRLIEASEAVDFGAARERDGLTELLVDNFRASGVLAAGSADLPCLAGISGSMGVAGTTTTD